MRMISSGRPWGLHAAVGAAALVAAGAAMVVAGPLNPPPGPVASTYKTLTEVEPRTNIATVSGSGTARHIISQPGSYYLSANILGASSANGIVIQADNVTLDLNGFALIGAAGSADGIVVSGTRRNVIVRNGVVRGWGGDGIDAADDTNVVVVNVAASDNGGDGIRVGPASVVTGCTSTGNTGDGIALGEGASAENCSARGNGATGIRADPAGGATPAGGCSIVNCNAADNTGDGFLASNSVLSVCTSNYNGGNGFNVPNCTVTDAEARNNGQNGFLTGNSTLARCIGRTNMLDGFLCNEGTLLEGCVARGNSGDGIQCDKEVTVRFCHVEDNFSGVGIRVIGTDCRLEANTLLNNGVNGILIGAGATGNTVFRNSASGHATNYSIVAGNDFGPIGSAASATSPWANIQH